MKLSIFLCDESLKATTGRVAVRVFAVGPCLAVNTVCRFNPLAILSEIFIQIGYFFFKSYARKHKWLFFLRTQHGCCLSGYKVDFSWVASDIVVIIAVSQQLFNSITPCCVV